MSRKKKTNQFPSQNWTEKMDNVLHDLIVDANSGTPIIVEGKKDKASLRALGIRGPIHCVNIGDPIFEVAEQLEHYNRIILLADFDDQGEKLSKKLASHLESKRCKADLVHWLKMKKVFSRLTKDVESLSSLVSKLQVPSQHTIGKD